MLKWIIGFSLRNSTLVLIVGACVIAAAAWVVPQMSVDVFPELNAPTVVIMTEAGGFAADEVEQYVTFPIESVVNGLPGVRRVRSGSATSLSIVWVEFEWGQNIYVARQLVAERLATIEDTLPPEVHSELAPMTSIAGEIMLISLMSDGRTSDLDLRAFAEFELTNRLKSVRGIAQVTAIGGELPEYQVNVRQDQLLLWGLSMQDVIEAAGEAHSSASAGYLPNSQGLELSIRQRAQVRSVDDIKQTVLKYHDGVPITIGQVAEVVLAGAPKRGTAAEAGVRSVVLTIQKAPGENTLALTKAVDEALDEIEPLLPAGVTLNRHVFRQSDFIRRSLENVMSVLRDAAFFVAIVLIALTVRRSRRGRPVGVTKSPTGMRRKRLRLGLDTRFPMRFSRRAATPSSASLMPWPRQ